MTISQTRAGTRADNHPARLAAIRAPEITAQRATARELFLANGGGDLLEMVGLDEGSKACSTLSGRA